MNAMEIIGLVVLALVLIEILVNFHDIRRYVHMSRM